VVLAGQSSIGFTARWPAAGAGRTVTLTSTSPSLTVAGSPQAVTVNAPGSFAWANAEGATLALGRNTTTVLATGVPAGAQCYPSPDMLPGITPTVVGSEWRAVGDHTVPTISASETDTALVAARVRDIVYEVIETADQHATAQNMRTGTLYGRGQAGGRIRIQTAITEAQDGDTLQISPGAIWIPGNTDGSGYLEAGMLHVYKSLTLTNIPGRGRWSLAPPSVSANTGWSGIIIREPNQTYSNSGDTSTSNPRKTIVIEGFDFSNWGENADDSGIKMRSNGGPSSWADYHASVTFRNFKLGKLPYYRAASGFAGSAENLTFEDGHVYDCGGGLGGIAGNDHNFYVTARNLTMRGVRSSRSRKNSADGTVEMDGHLAKLTFNNADIQGCSFDAGDLSDSSIAVQCKGGGNLVFRGNFVRTGPLARTATGDIVFEKESGNFGGWMFGLEGHSLLVEKNLFINHLPYPANSRAIVFFRPAISGNYLDQSLITSCVIRDNIAMTTTPNTGTLLIPNAPTSFADGTWGVSNSTMVYGPLEPGFVANTRALKRYKRLYGPISATGGTVATYQFVHPHGYVARSDAHRGLG
jgi:hypothetical protein